VLQKRPDWFDFSELLLFILFTLLLPFDILLLYIFPCYFPYVPSYLCVLIHALFSCEIVPLN
jgi:hypothetical protein